MAEVTRVERPLSPHLSVYRMYMTMIVSGLHRASGLGMSISGALVVWWFVAAATSREMFDFVDGLLTSWVGIAVMVISLWSLCHHFLNGIRHLVWDTGSHLGKKSVNRSAWYVLIGAPVLAAVLILIVLVR